MQSVTFFMRRGDKVRGLQSRVTAAWKDTPLKGKRDSYVDSGTNRRFMRDTRFALLLISQPTRLFVASCELDGIVEKPRRSGGLNGNFARRFCRLEKQWDAICYADVRTPKSSRSVRNGRVIFTECEKRSPSNVAKRVSGLT